MQRRTLRGSRSPFSEAACTDLSSSAPLRYRSAAKSASVLSPVATVKVAGADAISTGSMHLRDARAPRVRERESRALARRVSRARSYRRVATLGLAAHCSALFSSSLFTPKMPRQLGAPHRQRIGSSKRWNW